ncbi:hypothetical protein O6H91_02G086400 [Diphasiastrum complanatum]|uniref:Uncharacterized protein n=1 Tax=Diphasiastrum complanatum TaxID=34168 RepID=A0ACC2EI95_DIPCM|nr:hypothetical protein O6H91_02G086400 [Diphasiastrum complanatum]
MAKASSCAPPCSRSLLYFLCIAALSLLLLLLPAASQGFKSDELVEEEDEWGLVGRGSAQQQQRERVSAGSPRRFAVEQGDSSGADTKVEFRLEQAFGDSQYSEAGTFSARLKPSSRGGQALVKLRLSRKPLTDNEKSAFEELVKEDGFYTIRVPANVLNPGKTFVVSSTKARCLSASNLEERFDIYMEQGNVLAIGYGPARVCSYPRQLNVPSQWSFSSLIVSKTGEIASK